MTKRSPIVDPEEPDDTIHLDATKITAGTITANDIVIGEIDLSGATGQATFDASKYIMDRYSPTTNPRSSTQGLFQPIRPTWRTDD